MIKHFLVVILLIVSLVALVASRKPDSFRVERQITIKATPERIYPLVTDFRNWPKWSPWEKLDPAMQRRLSGAASGTGAVYEWSGNSKAGAGRMEIVEAAPSSKLRIRFDFLKPFRSTSTTDVTFAAQGDSTTVQWAMYGESNFFSKVMQVFVTMDDFLGKDFESGLAAMKKTAEQP